ncbi:cysteine--tRNA ligase [Halobacillus halophilus]|uniref:Cysteine--tRNA ligase n=1 Tax=Halobacillus halophilus (strain ATCC 35676 / DSM 2266 / JCM 20832 / KCTC 3685 / LMG 17431 / NBRC 102448 / NCIMB 2269) TaxID=866895 RepID=I0JH72_HALH3|nr:cysteine--tRNA ligase [Halobacillus halophilus]ASF37713.1 cysteine--tRNA ligase [Halobacillus halophilus]CCG43490.1 cysteinyl-tRNA synthetase [Halobacillus halophilus DSM 2266]
MSIHIYNTLTRKKEPFRPLEEDKVKMYVCGPTVYNYIHIGNARPAIVFDTVRRYFEYRGYDVHYVLNFTDVDDKLIKAANELGEEVPDIANRFIDAYKEDVGALGVKEAVDHPRVTENMDEIIDFVKGLIDKGYAYEAKGDVYFRTRSFDNYGKLSHQSVNELRSGARIEVGDKKEDPLDFTLWKEAKPDEISWESPWGNGRPGWHIECSAMAKKYLGETIDIHAGGQDLTFPHHENEIAQSEAHNDQSFARYWMHNGYINIENEKMSKSLGNFILAHDLVKKHDPQVIRFFMLSVQYRHPINFSDELLKGAKSSFDRIRNAYENLKHRKSASMNLQNDSDRWIKEIEAHKEQFIQEMDDDFNTANAISVLFDLTKSANLYLQEEQTHTSVLETYENTLKELMMVLGLEIETQAELLDEEVDALIEERKQARKDRNFERADQIRDELKDRNIILEDTSQGTRWKRG